MERIPVSGGTPRRDFMGAALGAGVGLFALAFLSLGITPFLADGTARSRSPVPPGAASPPPSLRDVFPDDASHAEALRRGRDLYVGEACWHCHSQFVRPMPEEIERYGPVSVSAEYSHDLQLPQLFGTRRVGPDLIRESGRRSDDWHLAHLWSPRLAVDASVMPTYPWYFREFRVEAVAGEDGWALKPGAWSEAIRAAPFPRFGVTPGADGRAFAREPAGTPVPVFPGAEEPDEGDVKEFTLVVPTRDAWSLVAYLQSLGRHVAPRRDVSAERNAASPPVAVGPGDADRGAAAYASHCASCHGEKGDGLGPAAPFLDPRPRDFTSRSFKYKTTAGSVQPLDSDLFASITVGLPGTAMPGWGDLPAETRWDLVALVARFAARGEPRTPPSVDQVQPVPTETPDDAASRERGKAAFAENCARCHGADAHGSREGTSPMIDSRGVPLRARDLADLSAIRAGRDPADLYRRLAIGIPGTPMPSFAQVEPGALWDMVHFVRSLQEEPAK